MYVQAHYLLNIDVVNNLQINTIKIEKNSYKIKRFNAL